MLYAILAKDGHDQVQPTKSRESCEQEKYRKRTGILSVTGVMISTPQPSTRQQNRVTVGYLWLITAELTATIRAQPAYLEAPSRMQCRIKDGASRSTLDTLIARYLAQLSFRVCLTEGCGFGHCHLSPII